MNNKIKKQILKEFDHGPKPKECQKYIVIHDTQMDNTPEQILKFWIKQKKYIATHFIVGKEGNILQCINIDKIGHHCGFGQKNNNILFDTPEDDRDDKRGTIVQQLDYGMNSWSIGIELVHTDKMTYYPEEQLIALDNLINHIDSLYDGYGGKIIDHKMWQNRNPDTSKEFEQYLINYQKFRHH